MRADSAGLFWVDQPVTRSRKDRQLGPMPPIPDTSWTTPAVFPNLSAAKTLAIDTETYDPNLKTKGPGWARGDGHIVGFSISVPDGKSWYFPIRHKVEPEYNIDPEAALRWAQYVLGDNRPKVGANIIYDVGWFRQEGVIVGGPLYDVQFAEALLDSEAPHVSLDALSEKHLGLHKQTELLYEWLAKWFGGKPTDDQRKHIHMSPPRLAGPYAEGDAWLPMRILQAQWSKLEARGAMHLFQMECGLIPLLIDMRFKGAKIDVDFAERYNVQLGEEIAGIENSLAQYTGFPVNVNSTADMARAFDSLGLPYDYTAPSEKFPDGQPSFKKDVIAKLKHGFPQTVVKLREYQKVQKTFVQGYLLDSNVNGVVHCQFHPLKSDESGARSGRFASSDPNLQNIPVRTKIGKQIRRAFVSEHGIRSLDYSQIEYRLLVHHAVGQGAEEARQRYRNDPTTDYHQFTIDLLYAITAIRMERKPAKNINFGFIYGMGKPTLFERIGDGAEKLYNAYHEAVPYAKSTMQAAAKEVEVNGYVETLLGRRSDFNMWEPKKWGDTRPALPFERAVREYGHDIRLAMTHKALNRKLQGGAADVMKMAMWKLYHWGYLAEVGIPMMTVHDELVFENRPSKYWNEVEHIMTSAVDVSIPLLVDCETGPNWGDVKK